MAAPPNKAVLLVGCAHDSHLLHCRQLGRRSCRTISWQARLRFSRRPARGRAGCARAPTDKNVSSVKDTACACPPSMHAPPGPDLSNHISGRKLSAQQVGCVSGLSGSAAGRGVRTGKHTAQRGLHGEHNTHIHSYIVARVLYEGVYVLEYMYMFFGLYLLCSVSVWLPGGLICSCYCC